jgi:hypothetical protein
MSAIAARRAELEAIARRNGAAGPGLQSIDGDGMAVTVDAKGRLVLPAAPSHDDPAALCAWLTIVFALDRAHPITGGVRQGLAGPEGHVELRRAGAQPLRFEPASQIDSPQRIHEALNWRMIPTDGAVPAFKGDHCRQIAHVIRMLCGWADRMTEADEASGIVGCYLGAAQAIEGHTTYGTVPQRYEAATALQRGIDDGSGRSVGRSAEVPARQLHRRVRRASGGPCGGRTGLHRRRAAARLARRAHGSARLGSHSAIGVLGARP